MSSARPDQILRTVTTQIQPGKVVNTCRVKNNTETAGSASAIPLCPLRTLVSCLAFLDKQGEAPQLSFPVCNLMTGTNFRPSHFGSSF